MQILIVGNKNVHNALATKLKAQNPDALIFVTSQEENACGSAISIDILPTSTDELVEFAQANEISLTIVADENAIQSGIVDAFNNAGLMVFAPDSEAVGIAYSKSYAKKQMYKLGFNTPKFGIFDKLSNAQDYLKKTTYPVIVKYDNHVDGERVFFCSCERVAQNTIENIFISAHQGCKIVIENYVQGREFSYYFLTDGYNALPISSVVPYKYSSDYDGGSITNGVGAYAPANFVSEDDERYILNDIVYPLLESISTNGEPYCGVLGIDFILDEQNQLWVVEFNSFFNQPDLDCVLELLEDDLLSLLRACCVGSLADDYEQIKTNSSCVLSSVLLKIGQHVLDNEVSEIKNLDLLDDDVNVNFYNVTKKDGKIFAKNGRVMSLSVKSSTLSNAKTVLEDNVSAIEFDGLRYRKDLLKSADER